MALISEVVRVKLNATQSCTTCTVASAAREQAFSPSNPTLVVLNQSPSQPQ